MSVARSGCVPGTMTWLGQWMLETFPLLAQIEGAFVSDDLQGKILGQ